MHADGKHADLIQKVFTDRKILPADLPAGVGWLRGPGGAPLPDELTDLTDVLVVAHEWLDVVPCVIGQLDASGVVREVLVDPASGDEDLGDPLADAELAWQQRFWPLLQEGDRVEVGLGDLDGPLEIARSEKGPGRLQVEVRVFLVLLEGDLQRLAHSPTSNLMRSSRVSRRSIVEVTPPNTLTTGGLGT